MQPSTRRRFLRRAITSGALAGLGTTHRLCAHPIAHGAENLASRTVEFTAYGAKISLSAMHAQPDAVDRALTAARHQIEIVDRVMSLYRPESQLCRLNRDKILRNPHPHLVRVLKAATAMSRRSYGAFDITVQPLWTLYAEAQRSGGVPDAAEVRAACRKIDWRRIEISPEQVTLHGDGTEVTLNGIAQGFAADRALAAMRREGIEHALVNAGEIGALGDKPQGDPWTVGIQHPRREDAYISLAKLRGRSLATSGDYATSFTSDHRYNHLFDPRSGRSPEEFASVSIVAPSACQADALATAVYVLGLERGLKLVQATYDADALIVFKDGRSLATAGFSG